MERYTENHYDGNGYYLICSGNCETINCGDCDILGEIVDRLAAYEDTGLEPEEIEQLKGEVFGLKVDKQELEQYRAIGPIDRLAAYEDTGLEPEDFKRSFDEDALLKLTGQFLGVTPDRLRELAQADREGRCVVLPCEVGDTIWMIVTKRPKISMPEFSFIKRSRLSWLNIERVLIDFGKTVFLTYEEAEAALRREPQEDDDCGHGERKEDEYGTD